MDAGTTTIEGGDPVPKRRRIIRKLKDNEDEGTESSSSGESDAGNNQQKGKKSIMKLTLPKVKLYM